MRHWSDTFDRRMPQPGSALFPGRGICAEAKDRRVLTRERVRERGAVCEIRVQNLLQFGVRDVKHPPSDCCHKSDIGMTERVAEGISADFQSRQR
jgi:hypothetical protein